MNMITVTDAARPDLGGNSRGGDNHAFMPVLWRYVIERFGIRSVLDVGCGEGHAVAFFHRLGVHAHGIDGLRLNVTRSVIPVALHDLTTGPYFMPVDLVNCVEVAEHLEKRYLDNFLDTLANGRVVLMTAAPPGQDGHHHVNCEPPSYWIEKMRIRGYLLSPELDEFRAICQTDVGFKYFLTTGLLFFRE
jgi:SAM-dependent methyltransferase